MRLNPLFDLFVCRKRRWLIALLAGVLSNVAQATVVVEDASFTPTLTGQTTAVLSLRLISSEALQLFDAKTPIAVGVRLSNYPLQDEQTVEADQAKHKKTTIAPFEQSIPIPANTLVSLDASGAHLRLIGIPGPLRVNQTVPLSLYFLDKKSRISILRVVARVRYKGPDSVPEPAPEKANEQTNEPATELDASKQSKDTLLVNAKSVEIKLSKPVKPTDREVKTAPLLQDQKNASIADPRTGSSAGSSTDSVLSQMPILDPIALPLKRPNYVP